MSALRVKICGIVNEDDALAAAQAGADAIGLQFTRLSPRMVTPEQAARIVRHLPPFVSTVGVFVNAEKDYIRSTIDVVGLDYVQLHGDETPEFCKDIPARVIKTVRVGDRDDLGELERYPVDAILLDTKKEGKYGGTGERFNWSLLKDLTRPSVPIILAGGLNPDNVAEAIKTTDPQALDVCSGVESSPATKSREKMQTFINNALGRSDGFGN